MKSIYSNPIRVYILLGAIALYGILCGISLPISLFPNSSKPQIWVNVGYGGATAEEFLNSYGKDLERQIRSISTRQVKVERVVSSYKATHVGYDVLFQWGVDPNEALKETQTIVNGFAGRLPSESRDSLGIWLNNENTGFFAVAFYSETRDLNSLYDLLEPILSPRIAKVEDAQDPVLWNPTRSEIRIELNPADMAALQLVPRDVETAIDGVLGGRAGGSVTVGENNLQIQMPRPIRTVPDLSLIPIPTSAGRLVHLSDIARIDVGPQTRKNRSFKTSGSPSLILYSVPKPGGNVKKMSEDLMQVVRDVLPSLPKDIRYRTLVDPSEFIRSAVSNVVHEVILAALLAVGVLFIFIGSFRNVFTAAIEIPMSIVLAFILMKISDMNLNLISLGGLALSAGMNVDASVVVMENIFRHFENRRPRTFEERLEILITAVKEVRFAIIAATISSLVVFAPLAFTSDLAFAILGDLAKAVVFSHGFSAFVALILVPTIRLQLMGKETGPAPRSIIDQPLRRLEEAYANLLGWFLTKPRTKWLSYASLSVGLAALIVLVLPRLPKEVIGTPDTDWLILGTNTNGNTLVKQMELQAEEVERRLLDQFGDKIRYTFSQIRRPNSATIMARLKDKGEMKEVWEAMDKHFTNTPLMSFWVGPWNPSELPIPNPPHLRIAVRGGDGKDRALVARSIWDLLRGKEVLRRVSTEPNAEIERSIILKPHFEQWESLSAAGSRLTPGDLADILRVATEGRTIGHFPHRNDLVEMNLSFPLGSVESVEAVRAFPVGVKGKLVPLKALATVDVEEVDPVIFREDQRELFLVEGRQDKEESVPKEEAVAEAKRLTNAWLESEEGKKLMAPGVTVTFEDPAKDVNEAIDQLGTAIGLSVGLIFLTLLLQFGTLVEPLVVLVSVPLGFIGVLISLWVFDSTLSLNAALGVILLNGIAVANSIILVDFIKRLVATGKSPREAALEAARKRLRPILITSLTTILGMLPIALGLGEGGHILQPLGIAVSGGLWVSTVLTLILVPSLQVAYMEYQRETKPRTRRLWLPFPGEATRVRKAACALLWFAVSASGAPFLDSLDQIVQRDPRVGQQRAAVEEVRGRTLSDRLSLLPSLSGTLSHTTTGGDGLTSTRQLAGASLGVNLFKFGADLSAMSGARHEIEAAEWSLKDTEIQVEEDGARGVLDLYAAEQKVKVLGQILKTRMTTLDVAKKRFRRGLIAEEEVSATEIDLENARAQLKDAEVDLVAARNRLMALLGKVDSLESWPWKGALQNPFGDEVKDSVLRNRPDWKAAELTRKAAEQRQDQGWGGIFPSLDASLDYGFTRTKLAGVTSEGPQWSGSVSLTIPLFDRLANYGNYRAAVARRSAAQQAEVQVQRLALQEWTTAMESLKISLETAKSRERTLGIARKLYEANLNRFNRGLVGANELRVDQDRFYQSELFAIQGWNTAHLSFIQLCHSTGMRVRECLNAKAKPR